MSGRDKPSMPRLSLGHIFPAHSLSLWKRAGINSVRVRFIDPFLRHLLHALPASCIHAVVSRREKGGKLFAAAVDALFPSLCLSCSDVTQRQPTAGRGPHVHPRLVCTWAEAVGHCGVAWHRRASYDVYIARRGIHPCPRSAYASPGEALNKAIRVVSAHGEQKAWFLLAFTTTACVEENGGTSLCRGKGRLNQRSLARRWENGSGSWRR